MSSFNFDKINERKGSGSSKWDFMPYPDLPENAIAMWVADMDFEAAPSVMASIHKGLEMPALGYFKLGDEYFDAIINWHKNRHGRNDFTKENLAYHNGVLGGVCSAVVALTDPGDLILVQGPGYPAFARVIENLGRAVQADPLINENGYYTYNFAQMEKTIKEKKIKVAILCNPHNPTGRVWSREELSEYIDICYRNGVKVIVDEIWADWELDRGNLPYTSAFIANEKTKEIGIGFYSASKGFNLAGLVASYSICHNADMQKALEDVFSPAHYNNPNFLSTRAVIGAYSEEGALWMDACADYVSGNMDLVVDYCQKNMPKLKVRKPDATYLMWLDFTAYGIDQDEIIRRTAYVAGVVMNDGTAFVCDGEGHMRMNMATPRKYVEEALPRLKAAFADIE